jgi:hypothetical protein
MIIFKASIYFFPILMVANSLELEYVGNGRCLDSKMEQYQYVPITAGATENSIGCLQVCDGWANENGVELRGIEIRSVTIFGGNCRCLFDSSSSENPFIVGSGLGTGNITGVEPEDRVTCYKVCKAPGVCGDPHFKTWHGEHFSYHGECDLVLVKSNLFSKNLGIRIHIRTKIEDNWSFVKNAAIKIGDDILEVEGRGKVWDKTADAVHFINGKINAEMPLQLAMKYPVERLEEKHCDTTGEKCSDAVVYKISLEDGDKILITQEWGVLRVGFIVSSFHNFRDAVGIMGHFSKPGYLARDGIIIYTDLNKFGQEWQVLEEEPMIFTERRAPQHPEQCILPATLTMRRLRMDSSVHQMAEDACAGVEVASKEFCIMDVTLSGRAEAATFYFKAYVG